jgi:excinuclease UvrABC ATPase subunit
MTEEFIEVHARARTISRNHLDAIRQADWIIDLGPEGGSAGGEVLYEGPPAGLNRCARSITARFI